MNILGFKNNLHVLKNIGQEVKILVEKKKVGVKMAWGQRDLPRKFLPENSFKSQNFGELDISSICLVTRCKGNV